jgi:hypothetical protein
MRFVLICKFCEMSGYTPKAVERKIADKVWRQGHEYRKSPDGRIHIDLDGYDKWLNK